MRSRLRIPLPLLVVLAAVLVEGLAWTWAVPALQGPDEGDHISYVQRIADANDVPWVHTDLGHLRGNPLGVSVEQRTAALWSGLEPLRGNVAARPLWTPSDVRIWERENAKLGPDARDSGLGVPAMSNPPLYYLLAAGPYAVAGGDFFDRLFAVRLANVALLLATVLFTWLLAGEVFARRRAAQTVTAAVVALQPVLLDTVTKVTPDALLVALTAAALYLMAVIVRRGPTPPLALGLVAVVVAACFTHGRGLGLIAPAVLALGVGWWRRRGGALPVRALVAGAVVALAGFTLYAARFRLGEVDDVLANLWRFYLPGLPGMPARLGPEWGVEQVYLDRFLGTFAQFEVRFPADLMHALRAAAFAGLGLLAVAAWRHRRAFGERRELVVVLAAAFLLEVLALHTAAFRSLLINPADPVFTGRYLLPLVPLLGLGVAAALTALPGRVRAGATGVVLAGGALLQLSALGVVVARFYA
jgi:4-amino-4-deoxy-L-arabinose transferase-like glycosyltransferase